MVVSVIKLEAHSDPACQVLMKGTLFVFMMSPIWLRKDVTRIQSRVICKVCSSCKWRVEFGWVEKALAYAKALGRDSPGLLSNCGMTGVQRLL